MIVWVNDLGYVFYILVDICGFVDSIVDGVVDSVFWRIICDD